ncbi:hypothetical protein AVEN_220482-1, partial [Araneus ventricosus]
MTEESVINVGL